MTSSQVVYLSLCQNGQAKAKFPRQAAIMAQVEEKQRQKQREKEQSMLEERQDEQRWRGTVESEENVPDGRKMTVNERQANQESQIESMAQALEQARLEAQRDRSMRRIQKLKQGGHDVHNLQANLEAAGITPRLPNPPPSDASLDTTLTSQNQNTPQKQNQNVTQFNRGYQEEPTQKHSFGTSPLRESSTQTESVIENTSNQQRKEISDAHIQYDPKSYTKPPQNKKTIEKVPEKEPKPKPAKQKLTDRPKWGMNTSKKVTALKNSDRELIDAGKRQRAEERKAKREQRLLALVEMNKNIVPLGRGGGGNVRRGGKTGAKTEVRGLTDDVNTAGITGVSRRPNKPGVVTAEYGVISDSAMARLMNVDQELGHGNVGRNQDAGHVPKIGQHGDHGYPQVGQMPSKTGQMTQQHKILSLDHLDMGHNSPKLGHNSPKLGHGTPKPGHGTPKPGQTSPNPGYNAPMSPVIPAVKHRMAKIDRHPPENYQNSPYEDQEYFSGGISEFVPFLRTTERFDPSSATDRTLVSREKTAARKARKAYIEGQRPGVLGNEMEDIDDSKYNVGYVTLQKDPIINPDVVTNHPTPRQDLILHQLHQLKQTLLQRQLEAESYLPYTDLITTDTIG